MNLFNAENNDEYHQLKVRITEGEVAAFRKLFDSLFDQLTQFAFLLVKSKETATEIVDDIFIRLWKNRADILLIDNIKIYLYKATKNTAFNYLSRTEPLHEPFDDIHIQLKEEYDPESLMISNEIILKIREAVNALPPRCKMIFKLIREDGLKYKEAADVLNVSIKTVDAQMVIAVSQIKEKLKGHLQLPVKKNLKKS